MSFWTSLRDTVESVASVAGDYLLPGSSLVTSQLVSKGAQEELNSPLGQLARLGTSLAGGGIGSSFTGIPSAADSGYGWGNAFEAISGTPTTASAGAPGLGGPEPLGGPAFDAAGGGVAGGAPGPQSWGQSLFSGKGTGPLSWLSPILSIGSGLYGMSQAAAMKAMAQKALVSQASPWQTSGGMAGAGTALTNVINGDFTNDPGFAAAQRAAAATSSQQPGGFAAEAAASAALNYQNQRIQALSNPAGVGFAPGGGVNTALTGMGAGNTLASQSLGSIGYGVSQATGNGVSMPPWLQQYLIQQGLGKTAGVA